MCKTYYVGWDVGAWHCDKNTNSRDAIVVLDKKGKVVIKKRKVVRCELNEISIFSFLNKYFGSSKFTEDDINYLKTRGFGTFCRNCQSL